MKERRKFVRIDVNVNVWWRKIPEDAVKTAATNKDISEQGIWLIVDEELTTGDKLQLEMELPTKKIIKCLGEVVWIEPFMIIGDPENRKYNTGVEFIEIEEQDRQELEKFIYDSMSKNE